MSDTFPFFVEPMLAVSGHAFDSERHLFEPKWDGIRCLFRYTHSARLFSRNGRDISAQFPELSGRSLLGAECYIVDGEIICLNSAGKPSFDLVKQRIGLRNEYRIHRLAKQSPAIYVAFDLLYLERAPVFDLALERRRQMLEDVWIHQNTAFLSPTTATTGKALLAAVSEHDLEGIVAKDRFSPYLPGKRSNYWVKVRRTINDLFWIVGYSLRDGVLRSLALAEQRGDYMYYVGHVGSGLNETTRRRLIGDLGEAARVPPPNLIAPSIKETVWVTPRLLCQVEYLEKTPAGSLRHPVFRGVVSYMR